MCGQEGREGTRGGQEEREWTGGEMGCGEGKKEWGRGREDGEKRIGIDSRKLFGNSSAKMGGRRKRRKKKEGIE